MAFIDQFRELSGTYPKLSDILAANLVNRAWATLRDERKWSWLVDESYFTVPAIISGGHVAVVQGSNQVQADVVSGPLLTSAALADPPLTSRQLRISTSIYSITGYDPGAQILTLDRAYGEASSPAASYSVYRIYYAAPSSDFLRFISIQNPTVGYRLAGKRLTCTKAYFDRIDPQRSSTGDPYRVGFYKTDPETGIPIYEFWPSPTNAYQLPFTYQRRGVDFVNDDDDLPATVGRYEFMALCHYHACLWAASNSGRYEELKGPNWLQLAGQHYRAYQAWLPKAKVADEEIHLREWGGDESDSTVIYDAKYAQSHDLSVME